MSQNLSQIEFQNQERVKIKSIRSEQKILILATSFLFIFLFIMQPNLMNLLLKSSPMLWECI